MEIVTNKKVICDNCGWSWKLSDGGNDPYICHKCGHDNEEKNFIGKRVKVYRNLHKDTFSVQYRGIVVLLADAVRLKNVKFLVQPAGNEKVNKEKKKNVHAFVTGILMDYCEFPCENLPEEPNENIVTYDPYRYKSFVLKTTEEPIYTAQEVQMIYSKNKIFVIEQ